MTLRPIAFIFACATGASLLTAACTGPTYDTTIPFVPDPPSVYVAKVKNILVGLPPTDAEVAAVVADPNALPGLIDGWMQMQQYQDKMKVFFELAFQQTQISSADFVDIVPPNGLGNGRSIPLLVQNVRDSFANTVLSITTANKPFTDSFKTHQIMMTTALMQLYAYLDGHPTDDNSKTTDIFAKANVGLTFTLEKSAGTIPIADSIDSTKPNYMHWYNPDIVTQSYPDPKCNGVDPITVNVNSNSLFNIFYGEIPAHTLADGTACPIRAAQGNGIQLLPSDFTDWRMITIRKPTGSEKLTQFFDLPTMRSKSELLIGTPRLGYFTTPAFQANWPTNSSNQMRVTVNQALIVATGNQIDGTDGTTPSMTPGLDSEHAAPGSACYGCHQLLDPTRSILSSTYSWFYSTQTDQTMIKQPGLFAFQHVIAPMATIDDFASLLASHPLVPQAWAQKLCYYVNSAACDLDDPEFQRIVAGFSGNAFNWNSLVRDLLSSPIVTNATPTITHAKNGEVIAVSRRDHLCAALNNRLGFVDICQLDAANQAVLGTIAQIVSGMPSDGYGRGGVIPILPNQPNLFYRGGLENVCANIASMVIDAAPNPKQPGAKKWSSSQPDAAIAEFVSLVMALSIADDRSAAVNAALTDHFNAAKSGGASATDALRSTFVAACLSPSFIGIGM
jgi:hypothetical protein